MFDFHLHSKVSFDSTEEPFEIVRAAEVNGLKEICFTDHYDFNSEKDGHHDLFTVEDYNKAYDSLQSEKVKIYRGVEFGLTDWNQKELKDLLMQKKFDFVLGSVHYVGGFDPYFKEFWDGITFDEAIDKYLLQVLKCVKKHNDFDVLGHITYVCKSVHNPTGGNVLYSRVCDITDEILKTVIDKGKGIENVEKAMEPLYTTVGGERAGLGFAVMQSFCDKVRVKSAPQKGTTVTLIKRIGADG